MKCACPHHDACVCFELRYGSPCDSDIGDICECSCHYETDSDEEMYGIDSRDRPALTELCRARG